MAITTVDGVLAGMQPPVALLKTGVAMKAIGLAHSHFYSVGAPGAAVAPSPGVNGAALTTYAGQIPFTNPGAGNSYLARFVCAASQACTLLVCDRLWHNSGLSVTSAVLQSIVSGAMPARDANGATAGVNLLCGVEWSTAGGAGTPTLTLTYTNQAGTGSRTAVITATTTPNAGTLELWGLQAGDTGIRTIEGYTASATRTSGTFHLVVYRVLATIPLIAPSVANGVDALTSGFVRLYDNTVPFLVQIPSATTLTTLSGQWIVTQG